MCNQTDVERFLYQRVGSWKGRGLSISSGFRTMLFVCCHYSLKGMESQTLENKAMNISTQQSERNKAVKFRTIIFTLSFFFFILHFHLFSLVVTWINIREVARSNPATGHPDLGFLLFPSYTFNAWSVLSLSLSSDCVYWDPSSPTT